jgi:hypothetical protein
VQVVEGVAIAIEVLGLGSVSWEGGDDEFPSGRML